VFPVLRLLRFCHSKNYRLTGRKQPFIISAHNARVRIAVAPQGLPSLTAKCADAAGACGFVRYKEDPCPDSANFFFH